ncbi:MAG: histidinol dehydrogenase [Luteitalea sp.]|nr:histidinol dehydrogenase [Luteitalea sp.]
MRIIVSSDARAVGRLLDRGRRESSGVERRVRAIVDDVRRGGDRAVVAYARQYDRLDGAVEVTRNEIAEGVRQTPVRVRRALAAAARHIRVVARAQVPRGWKVTVAPGIVVEQRVTPLARVGCYVPAGRYPLPSSLLMTAIPARVAGVDEVVAVCPHPHPVILAAAAAARVDRIFRVGGAHAIAALAYGTATIPRVDKIVGPGSTWVAAAKDLVSRDCAIDFHAGPSEIVIVATLGDAAWLAADLLAQAEHDVDARALLLTPSRRLARTVARAVDERLPADGPARSALQRNGGIILTRSVREAVALANRIAPEHLVCETDDVARQVTAGTVFVGPWSAQAAGDYATGSNHVLPTNGAARFRGGLSAADFVRVSSVQRLTRKGLARIASTSVTLAEAEGLHGHAASIKVRLPPPPPAATRVAARVGRVARRVAPADRPRQRVRLV